ncbi:MAG: fructose-1,6-bisphosphatase [Firmicutes bacterium]|nr:fructose-1,6-bisphosphatase [Bacillota bacterium]MBR0481146.1 fructose-1,6-bisphosphatase [Bacillota bacterium]
MDISKTDLRYLRLLSETYPTKISAATEIINLSAIQNLPKGTEHFLSDIHGEYEAFVHILRNASGTIRRKIDETFPDVPESERRTLATLIYYPKEKLEIIEKSGEDMDEFYEKTINRLVKILEVTTFKYTRSYLRKKMPGKFAYIIEELLFSTNGSDDFRTSNHRESIVTSIIEAGEGDDLTIALCDFICATSIFKLHILGDVYDRGKGGDKVVETLMNYHDVDIQWGNHDILWMGAAAGNTACIANVIRICTRYDNLHTLEVGYGISLRPLITFALKTYADDPCSCFKAVTSETDAMHDTDLVSLAKISKAIAIIQFKLEGAIVKKHPYYEMDALPLLHKVDYEKGTVVVDGIEYKMEDTNFPTIDPKDPYRLTEEEEAVVLRLQKAFTESVLLQEHVRFLYDKGSLYKRVNGNLLFHGCMPLTEDGEFDPINTSDGYRKGKDWFNYADGLVRKGYFGKPGIDKERGIDMCWFLWCGYKSPLFGKKKITTFERLFIKDPVTWIEEDNPYYRLLDRVDIVEKILKEFDADVKEGCIINGHMPVKKGTNPLHAGGRAMVIDGGFAKPYQKTTGIAGYSLVQNSYGFILTAHDPFESKEKAIEQEMDIHSTQVARQDISERMLNKYTDDGKKRQETIETLKMLVEAYKEGLIEERE